MTHPTDDSLKPCPFCGAGTTEITPKGRMWTGMKYSEPSSVSVRHWCEAVPGQPSRMIERVGRDEASAIDAWNTRALLAEQSQEPKAEDAPSDDELKDLAHSAYEEAMSFGLSVDTFLRYFKGIRNRAAIAAERKAP